MQEAKEGVIKERRQGQEERKGAGGVFLLLE
jgi:hypothetical protein